MSELFCCMGVVDCGGLNMDEYGLGVFVLDEGMGGQMEVVRIRICRIIRIFRIFRIGTMLRIVGGIYASMGLI